MTLRYWPIFNRAPTAQQNLRDCWNFPRARHSAKARAIAPCCYRAPMEHARTSHTLCATGALPSATLGSAPLIAVHDHGDEKGGINLRMLACPLVSGKPAKQARIAMCAAGAGAHTMPTCQAHNGRKPAFAGIFAARPCDDKSRGEGFRRTVDARRLPLKSLRNTRHPPGVPGKPRHPLDRDLTPIVRGPLSQNSAFHFVLPRVPS
jgi:hypothetical protein